jgi:hypothetical protein
MTTHVFKPLAIALLLGIAPLSISTAYAVATGPAGPTGATGAKGTTGLQGPAGLAGNNGTNGSNGARGAVGATGPVGPSGGVKGDKGIQGLPGANSTVAGPKGDQGLPGNRGPTGSVEPGNYAGDMKFWNGSTWLIIPAPMSNIGSLEICNGVLGWNVKSTCIEPNTIVRSIGGNGPAGGKVFYVTAGGLHGLEAAPADQSSSSVWCYSTTTISGARGTAVGTGAANTAAIVAGCGDADTAAKIADAYVLNGYTDWFLPSKDELNALYLQKVVVGGFSGNYYFSSSEYSSSSAWVQYFTNGSQINQFGKYDGLYVRAVRAF